MPPPVGYELLKRMTFEDRIRTTLPFLRDIVVGLSRPPGHLRQRRRLPPRHQAGNIYVKRDDTGVSCVPVIWASPPNPSSTGPWTSPSMIALVRCTTARRNKEHFDVANVGFASIKEVFRTSVIPVQRACRGAWRPL
jgi:hypothetical protein